MIEILLIADSVLLGLFVLYAAFRIGLAALATLKEEMQEYRIFNEEEKAADFEQQKGIEK